MASTFNVTNMTCAVCGKVSDQQQIGLMPSMPGVRDLDLRPGGIERTLLPGLIMTCPHCGYVNDSIADKPLVDMALFASDAFRQCDGLSPQADLARSYIRKALLDSERHDFYKVYKDYLQAAWASDDVDDKECATQCRLRSLNALDQAEFKNTNAKNDSRVVKADILRRAGLFDQLIEEYTDAKFSPDILNTIIKFQIERAKQGDKEGIYTVNDAVEAMA